uniref:G protein-coupled receptor 174 n=1 Tax=Gouania willdenowi TaxID=441366 RepID=A0A8C5I254_GOUWI
MVSKLPSFAKRNLSLLWTTACLPSSSRYPFCFKMNQSCGSPADVKAYQHYLYAVVYSVILETKKAVIFMMNLAVADLLQVLSLPLRIYYYLNDRWPFGHPLCMIWFYLKYVNMYASIYFLVCISVRRCELIMRPLKYHSSRRKGDLLICGFGWLLVCFCCLAFPLLRSTESEPGTSSIITPETSSAAAWALLVIAELMGFIIPLLVVLACTCMTAGSLREVTSEAVLDRGEKRRALRMVLSCAGVFLICFVPYHVTMPLDFLVKAKALQNCTLRNMILRCHPVNLCLASLNCSLDPLMYYFTTNEFWRRLSKPEIREAVMFNRRQSSIVSELKTCRL